MLIIFEGCDGTGKTTLANKVAEELPLEATRLLHRGVPTRSPIEEYTDLEGPYDQSHHVICDRWHWGELVYGPLYRDRSELGLAGLREVEDFLRPLGAIVVWLREDPQVIRRRLADRGESYLQDRHIETVLDAYGRVAAMSTLPTIAGTAEQLDPWFILDFATEVAR